MGWVSLETFSGPSSQLLQVDLAAGVGQPGSYPLLVSLAADTGLTGSCSGSTVKVQLVHQVTLVGQPSCCGQPVSCCWSNTIFVLADRVKKLRRLSVTFWPAPQLF
jgi:hypothetical protein